MAKNVKKYRIYLATEIYRSNDIPDYLKNLLVREPATYRIQKQEGSLTPKEKRESREVVRSERNIKVNLPSGEEKEIKINLVEFDKSLWRYYIEVSNLEELFDFFDEISGSDIAYMIENVENLKENAPKFLEINFGLEEIEGYVLYMEDAFLMDEEEFEEMEEGEDG